MTPLFGFMGMLLGWTMSLLSLFLILLVLVQRGRGGGLTGALGGPGGQSAFGSKAGDMFTKITSGTALVWIALCALATASLGEPPLQDDDFVEDDVPAMISDDPADTATLSFPPGTEPDATSPGLGDATLSPAPGAAEIEPALGTPAVSEPAESTPAESESAEGTPAESDSAATAESEPAELEPAEPAESEPAADSEAPSQP